MEAPAAPQQVMEPPKTDAQPRVLIVQPDDDICCGMQLPVQEDSSSGGEVSTDSERAAKLVDEASRQAEAPRAL